MRKLATRSPMNHIPDRTILLLSPGGTQRAIYRLVLRSLFLVLAALGISGVIGSGIVQRDGKDLLLFGLGLIVWSFFAYRQAGRLITSLQLNTSGVYIETLITKHFYPIANIQDITVKRSRPYWNMVHRLTLLESSKHKEHRFYLMPLYYVEVAPIDFSQVIENTLLEFSSALKMHNYQTVGGLGITSSNTTLE